MLNCDSGFILHTTIWGNWYNKGSLSITGYNYVYLLQLYLVFIINILETNLCMGIASSQKTLTVYVIITPLYIKTYYIYADFGQIYSKSVSPSGAVHLWFPT